MKRQPIKARDSYATINGDNTTHDYLNGIEIIADDGRPLFSISLLEDGSIEVSTNMVVKHNGVMLEDDMHIVPKSVCRVVIKREIYTTTAPEG